MALSSGVSSASMEWEEARAEFFQETYPSSVSDSIGVLTNASANNTGRRTVIESAGTGSRRGLMSTLESRTSKASRHSNNNAANRTPPTASTTPADAISPTGDENHHSNVEAGNPLIMHNCNNSTADRMSHRIESVSRRRSDDNVADPRYGHVGGRMTKSRMRAAVQGLEEEDSDDGEIEVVDFTDGK